MLCTFSLGAGSNWLRTYFGFMYDPDGQLLFLLGVPPRRPASCGAHTGPVGTPSLPLEATLGGLFARAAAHKRVGMRPLVRSRGLPGLVVQPAGRARGAPDEFECLRWLVSPRRECVRSRPLCRVALMGPFSPRPAQVLASWAARDGGAAGLLDAKGVWRRRRRVEDDAERSAPRAARGLRVGGLFRSGHPVRVSAPSVTISVVGQRVGFLYFGFGYSNPCLDFSKC